MTARKATIDLLSREGWAERPLGKFLLWALTVGRYIVIFTELVVIAGFIVRIALDRNLNYLNEDLIHQQAILASQRPVELRMRRVDEQLGTFTRIVESGLQVSKLIEAVGQITPVDVRLELFELQEDALKITAVSLSPGSFASFILGLQINSEISDVILDSVKSGSAQDPSIKFQLTAEFENAVTKQLPTTGSTR